MKTVFYYLTSFIIILTLFGFSFLNISSNTEPEGQKIFTDSKCNTCHSIKSLNIEAKLKKKDIVDLSVIGKSVNADLLNKYLMKKEKINDKQHPALFKGTEKELEVLSKWLCTLKTL